MRPSNPAVFECPKSTSGVHRWRVKNNVAECVNCKLQLSKEDSADLYFSPGTDMTSGQKT